VKSGPNLIREIDETIAATPTLWRLGHSGFIVRSANITFYVAPCCSDLPRSTRAMFATPI
jgi:L-ascorbate metabolism protein UlaG (beta-lactamase superfamily)